jgi:putative glutamine amidotransferase
MALDILHSHQLGGDDYYIRWALEEMNLDIQPNWHVYTDTIPGGVPDLVYLAGGSDIDFRRYGGNPELCGIPSRALDVWDQAYIPIALKEEWPILGICRGHQTLAVELGGRLIEEIYPAHGIYESSRRGWGHIVEGEWGTFPVNSLHHQAIDYDSISDKVTVVAWALDGMVEAYYYKDFAIGVQWHPEFMSYASGSWQLVEAVLTRRADQIASFDPYIGITYKEEK